MKGSFKKLISYLFLTPLSLIWEFVYKVRRFFYNYGILKQHTFHVPIISVGNLTFGGTGKTPFTLWLSKFFSEKNRKIMILMRGYKGKLEHSSGILRTGRRMGFNSVDYGDEALLYGRRLKNASVVVGKNRSENLDYYFETEDPDIVILDDGHQHLKLKRRLNIVLFDALMPLDHYKTAPRGYMREGLSALKDADIVILGRADLVSSNRLYELRKLLENHVGHNVPFGEIGYHPLGLFDSNYKKVMKVEDLKGRKIICIAGIASPTSFFDLIESLGADIIGKISFPDHHYFTAEELQHIIDDAEKDDAFILTTEKDIVKIKRVTDSQRIIFLEIEVEFLKGEKEVREILNGLIDHDDE